VCTSVPYRLQSRCSAASERRLIDARAVVAARLCRQVGLSVKAMMDQYQSTEAKHRNVETLDDMRRFMMEHMDFQRLQVGALLYLL
jgi:hypothetical protein